jgi:hypothetical protein
MAVPREMAGNAYFPGTPATALRWNGYGERLTLTTRTLPKEGGEWVQSIVAPQLLRLRGGQLMTSA